MKVGNKILSDLWRAGYSVAELWGYTSPVLRRTSDIVQPHALLWGILRIAEDQIDVGAGHRYFRQRVSGGDWVGIGFLEGGRDKEQLVLVPPLMNAKFGRTKSAIGDEKSTYVDVRFVHHKLFDDALQDVNKSAMITVLKI